MSVRQRVIALISLIVPAVLMIAGGCGTTHHFLAPRPLEKGEVMMSFAWHYDFANLHIPDVMPDGNFYFGTGKDYNVGFGFKVPTISLNHFTVARYWEVDGGDYRSAYVHLNQILGSNNNPYLELGGAYIKWDNSRSQIFSAGLGLGTGLVDPLVNTRRLMGWPYVDYPGRLRLIPFAKYVVAGSEFGFSASWYFGMTRSALDRLDETLRKVNDTVMFIEGEQIESVITCDECGYPSSVDRCFAIVLKSSDTVMVDCPIYTCGSGEIYLIFPFFPAAVALYDGYSSRASLQGEYCDIFPPTGWDWGYGARIDLEDLREKAARGEDIAFMTYSPEVLDWLDRRRKNVRVWHDLSLGISTVHYED